MNIENLLGKLLQETVGSGFKQQGSHNATRHSGADSLLGSLTNQLASGQGLMTAIGLGVGAYEIFRSGGQQQPQVPPTAAPSWGTLPPAPSAGMNSPPPLPPLPGAAPAQTAPAPAVSGKFDDQEMARRLIRVMVAAAHADGTLDAEEEKAILDRLRSVTLSQEEKMFLLEELHHPRPIAELTEGLGGDPRLARTMYAVALSAIVVDTDSERQWLNELGSALGLSPEIRSFIEETR